MLILVFMTLNLTLTLKTFVSLVQFVIFQVAWKRNKTKSAEFFQPAFFVGMFLL